MTKHPFLERLTHTHIAVPLGIFTVISGGILYLGYTQKNLSLLLLTMLFLAGMLFFTLLEYLMHRYLYHIPVNGPRMERFAYIIHGVHHDYPRDKSRLAMPPVLSITLAVLFFLLYRLIMNDYVFGFLPGFLMGYVAYLGVHYSVHAYKMPKNFLKILWIHHSIHHYSEPDRAFGVSSPLWDVLFGTMPRRSAKKRSAEGEVTGDSDLH